MKKNRPHNQQLVDTFQQTNSADSFEQLYNQYVHKVYQTCLSITNDDLSAQDHTSEIFIRVLDKVTTPMVVAAAGWCPVVGDTPLSVDSSAYAPIQPTR
ncbi:RNA polymerase sigma factor [Spirosoma fluminis]